MTRNVLLLVLGLTACHARPRTPPPPLPPPQARVEAAIARWGTALHANDEAALTKAVDHGGQFALVYGAIKKASSYVPDGERAVEQTLTGLIGLTMLQLLAPGIFGPPFETFYVVLPTGPLGPPLVAAGLAQQMNDGTNLAIVPLPWDKTIGRIDAASKRHIAKLREREAWTCRPTKIEATVLPSERGLVSMARVSKHIFADWLATVEALWLVRAECDGGSALFVVTALLDGNDQILLATGPRTPEELGGHIHALALTGE